MQGEKTSCIIVRYSEIALKKGNRKFFENQLIDNLKKQFEARGIPFGKIYRIQGRIMVETSGEDALAACSKVFGVASVSPAVRISQDVGIINDEALSHFENTSPLPKSFRITARRLDKNFKFTSQEMAVEVGGHVCENTGCKVSLKGAELDIGIEYTKDYAYVHTSRVEGPGGLPTGVSGKVLVFLSGGIDSPVAAWLCMRRGLKVTLIHFLHGEHAEHPDKIIELYGKLREYDPKTRLIMTPMNNVEREILKFAPAEYRIVLLRRLFLRIAEMFSKKKGFKAVATGDNIGQVASQTIDNMAGISCKTGLLWIRPLVCFTKHEIISLAEKIGTYDISLKELPECCSFLVPRHPSTNTDADTLDELEERIPKQVVEDAFKDSKWVKVK